MNPAVSMIGLAVDPTSYAPNREINHDVPLAVDRGSGALLTLQRALTPMADQIGAIPESDPIIERVSPTSATDVYSAAIPMTDYGRIAIMGVNVVTANVSATAAKLGLQWSADGVNWAEWDDQEHTAPTAGALASTKLTKTFNAATTGFKATANLVAPKWAKYARASCNSGAAVTIAVDLYIQLL